MQATVEDHDAVFATALSAHAGEHTAAGLLFVACVSEFQPVPVKLTVPDELSVPATATTREFAPGVGVVMLMLVAEVAVAFVTESTVR